MTDQKGFSKLFLIFQPIEMKNYLDLNTTSMNPERNQNIFLKDKLMKQNTNKKNPQGNLHVERTTSRTDCKPSYRLLAV